MDVLGPGLFAVIERFIIYGALGWCVEIVFTGLSSAIFEKDAAGTAKTYLWMHPIYGTAMLGMEMLAEVMHGQPWLLRGLVYVAFIYAVEFSAGWLLCRILGKCPWDYSGRGLHIRGLIRLDYAPAWFFAGLLFEPVHKLIVAAVHPSATRLATMLMHL